MITAEEFQLLHRTMRDAQHHPGGFCIVPKITTADGQKHSVQASQSHYCKPKASFEPSYTNWEYLGPACPDNTPLGFVTTAEIVDILNRHGGIKK